MKVLAWLWDHRDIVLVLAPFVLAALARACEAAGWTRPAAFLAAIGVDVAALRMLADGKQSPAPDSDEPRRRA